MEKMREGFEAASELAVALASAMLAASRLPVVPLGREVAA
jgi:hypothetical protein